MISKLPYFSETPNLSSKKTAPEGGNSITYFRTLQYSGDSDGFLFIKKKLVRHMLRRISYGVATVSRIDKIMGFFCKRDL